jgi:hypothetical protein
MSDLEEPKPGISRRTVAKAAAWSVPAIALAVSTPAYAASPDGVITLTGDGCKLPGNATATYKGYAFEALLSNTTAADVTVAVTSITLNGTNLGASTFVAFSEDGTECTNLGSTFVVPAGAENIRVAILTANAANSANGTLVLTYTVDGVPAMETAQADATPPIVGGSCRAFSSEEKDCLAALAIAN